MRVRAYAKLNLCLEVLGRRDDGYHEIRSVMQTIDLWDELEVKPASSLRVECDLPGLDGENNLVWRAATELARAAGRLPLAEITVRKNIPLAMGLGGGSSDAAAALLALNDLWGTKLPLGELAVIAARLGSDVPFFLWGGCALATGRGEVIEPLPTRAGAPLTLVCPGESVSDKTSHMYRQLSNFHYSDGGVTRRLVQNSMAGCWSDDLPYNAFHDLAVREFPGLGEIMQAIERATGRRPNLTGTGPATFLLPSTELEHAAVTRALQPYPAQAYFVQTIGTYQSAAKAVPPAK